MRDHKSIIAWQEARALSVLVFNAARSDWKPWCSALFSQLQRAALSVQLNIAEGYAYGPGAKQTHHVRISYGSAVETAELLEPARDLSAIDKGGSREMLARNARCRHLLLGMLKLHHPL
jgi:four helix bundle protein